MREPRVEAAAGNAWTIPERIDDGCTRYALDGAVVWAAVAMSRALVGEELQLGDPRFERLIAIQRELVEIREEWGVGEGWSG